MRNPSLNKLDRNRLASRSQLDTNNRILPIWREGGGWGQYLIDIDINTADLASTYYQHDRGLHEQGLQFQVLHEQGLQFQGLQFQEMEHLEQERQQME